MSSSVFSPRNRDLVRVLVADSTPMGCELVRNSLKRSNQAWRVGSASSSSEVLTAIRGDAPHVVLLSVNLDEQPLKGLRLARQLRVEFPEIRLVMLLDVSRRDLVVESFRAGARGVFCRTVSVKTLSKCVYCVYTGQVWADTKEMRFVLEALAEAVPLSMVDANGIALLSQREQEVVRRVADGLTNRQIAADLRISEHTVKNYLFRIFDKLGVSSRVEMILYALSHYAAALRAMVASADLPRDDVGAFEWYRRAAEQGLGVAQFMLGQMYRDGYGVPEDKISAYMWFLVAEHTANYNEKSIRAAAGSLAKRMALGQIAEARRRAEGWLRDHPVHAQPLSSYPSGGERSLAMKRERPRQISAPSDEMGRALTTPSL
jgi:two-component system nitrate/nitrite response regulator NarL